MKPQLTKLQIAIIVAHSMRRMLRNFEPHEQTQLFAKVSRKIKKFLMEKQKKVLNDFVFATEYERILWQNATDKYDKQTPIFGMAFVSELHEYFSEIAQKYIKVSSKEIEKLGVKYDGVNVDSKKGYEIESNGTDLLSTYIKLFEKDSGVGVKKSLFQGKKLIIKNNLIIEGKRVASGF